MQFISFIPVAFLCWTVVYFLPGVKAFSCFLTKAEILPKKLVYTKGESITLTCIINPNCYTGPVNASSLGFRVNSTNYPPEHPYVKYVNETTTTLTVPNSSFNSGGVYQCVQFEDGVNKKIFGFVNEFVKVGVPPPKVNNASFDCVVYNWLYMNCSFDPGQSTNLQTTYTWSYSISRSFYRCPIYDNMSHTCKWSKQDDSGFMPLLDYVMQVKAENSLGVSKSFYAFIYPAVLVKPASVKDIKVLAIRSASVVITFVVVAYEKPQIFRISYKSQFDDTWKYKETDHLKFNSTLSIFDWIEKAKKTLNVKIDGLIPFAKYSYKINAIPSIDGKPTGFWSDDAAADGLFQQPSDVPWAAPVFAPGSFQRSDCKNNCPSFCGDNCAEVTIFWPKVEERYRNGYIVGYKVEGAAMAEDPIAGISISKKMYLNNNKRYHISLKAATEIGYSPNSSTICISRKTEAPAAPAYVAAIGLDSSTVQVKWQQIEGNDQQLPTTYTVFWCKGKNQCIYKSNSDLYYRIVPANVRSILINMNSAGDSVYEYWFSVSANNDHGYSSGMISSEYVYRPDSGLSPPVLREPLLEVHNAIAVYWSTIQCDKKNNAIIYYEIWFCEVQPEKKDICQAGTEKKETANGNETRHKISNVKSDSLHLVWAVSVTASGKSAESKKVETTTSDNPYQSGSQGFNCFTAVQITAYIAVYYSIFISVI